MTYHYSSLVEEIRNEIIAEAKASTMIDDWFLPEHLMEVERLANWLCDEIPEADRDVVALSVWFHDKGRLVGIDDGHDVYGAKAAKERLGQADLPPEKIELVANACLAHRAEEIKPESVEAKILATADAMSHFVSPNFYFRVFEHYRLSKPLEEVLEIVSKKLDRDYLQKMLFDLAKEKIKSKYDAWKIILKQELT